MCLLHVPLGILSIVEVTFPVCAVMARVTIVTHQHTSTMQFSVHSASHRVQFSGLAVLSSQLELQMPCSLAVLPTTSVYVAVRHNLCLLQRVLETWAVAQW